VAARRIALPRRGRATLVGKVRVVFDESLSTGSGQVPVECRYGSAGRHLAKGDELGRFEFGSTLVLVGARGALSLDPQPPESQLRLGRRVGRLTLPVR
jgi:phosphatidylserine decarboxylase